MISDKLRFKFSKKPSEEQRKSVSLLGCLIPAFSEKMNTGKSVEIDNVLQGAKA